MEADMKSLTWLLVLILQDCGMKCGTTTLMDEIKIVHRIKHEGLSFLTITLPNFCQDFERSLDRGFVGSTDFVGFTKKGCLPKLFLGFTTKVFDGNGKLLDDPSIDAIESIRQLCLMWKKINLPCDESRVQDAFSDYIKCESELNGQLDRIPDVYRSTFQEVCRIVWNTVPTLDTLSSEVPVIPRHGPGATAERVSGNQKYVLPSWHVRLEPFFPYDLYGLTNHNYIDRLDEVKFYEPDSEPPVRVITVPKTLKGPRIIAIEPVCMQYTQQALMRFFMKSFQRSCLISGQVNFSDQSINQRLALEGSRKQNFATLDLKEASDRVSVSLVELMLSSRPDLLGPVLACRSTKAKLPSGFVIPLRKFASMGSALCFPIESMVFFSIVLTGAIRELNLPVNYRTIKRLSRSIFVFGDDIIVPVDMVPSTLRSLTYFGMKVNERKSFWTGKFRESCGMDSYDGQRVTPTYVRRLYPESRKDATSLISWVSFCNQLYFAGYWSTCRALRHKLEKDFGPFPHVARESPALGWHNVNSRYDIHRWNKSLHRFEVKALVVGIKTSNDSIDGHSRLLRYFLNSGSSLDRDTSPNLLRIKENVGLVRSDSVTLKSRWISPY
jgi:hypothetical protein